MAVRFTVLILACWWSAFVAHAQLADPLGNTLFFGKGTPIYALDANYGLLDGGSTVSRDKLFREKTGNRNYFTFDIARKNLRHQITVGNFPAKFSSFGLSKELFDAARWTLTVPRARGSASVFLARLTNTTFGSDGRPIEGRVIASGADWYLAGIRAEANLGAWDVRLANLPEFSLPLPRVGVSFVNRFFTNYDLSRATNPFRGVVITNPPTDLYLRIRDDSPETDSAARVYRIQMRVNGQSRFDFQGGREPPGVVVLPTTSIRSPEGDAREVSGDGAILYRFPLFSPQDIKVVEFLVDVAGDYVVEISSDNNVFLKRIDSEGDVDDGSNRTVQRFTYGELTDESTFGFDVQATLAGFSVEGETSWYSPTLQYPIFNAERHSTRANAHFVDVNRRFGPVFWRGEYTYMDPFYNASNFVDDNDNEDPYLDSREPSVPFAGSDQDDRDRDGVKDWDDDFLLFFADPPKFVLGLSRESMDFNNNGVPDNLEDNEKPNYRLDYDEGTKGFHTYAVLDVPTTPGLSFIPGYYEKNVITQEKHARGLYNIIAYAPNRIENFGRVQGRYTVRRSKDTIPDDVIVRGRKEEDQLALGDYIGNIFTLIVDYDNVKNLTIRTKFKYEYNVLFNSQSRLVDAQLINQIRYEYRLRDDLSIAPAFRNDRTIGFSVPARVSAETNAIRNAYIVSMTHQVADELQLSGGYQFLTWRDLADSRQDYNRRVGFLQLVLQGKAFDQSIGLITSVDFVNQTFRIPIGGDIRETNISVQLFLL